MKTICAGTNSKCLDKINDTCHKWKQWEKTFLVDIVWYTFRNAWNRHISWCGKDGTLTEEQTIDATASTCFISSLGMSRAAYAMASWTIGAWVVSRNVMQCLFFDFFVYCICIGYELYAASSQIYDMMICIYMILWDIFTNIRYEQHFDIFQYLQGPTACHGHNHPIMERMAERWCWEYTWYCGNSTLHHVQLHIRYAHSFLFPLCRY